MKYLALLTAALFLLNGGRARAAEKSVLLEGFESETTFDVWPPEAAKAKVTDEWASEGKRSLLVRKGTMVVFNQPGDWSPYQVWRFHTKVPGNVGVNLALEIADSGPGVLNRHQDSTSAPPGESVVEIDISGDLWRGEINKPNRLLKTPIDKKNIQRFAIAADSGDVYIDQIELATVEKIATPGGFAFQLGRKGAVVQGQWIGINPQSRWNAAKGYGITGGEAFDKETPYPTPVMGGGITMDGAHFEVNLKAGPYVGWLILERSGFWEDQQASYDKASLLVNDQVAHSHQWDKAGSLFDFQDLEVLDQEGVIKMVLARNFVTDFKFAAKDGKNSFTLNSEGGLRPPRLSGLVIAPDTAEGRAFIEAHKKLQHDTIEKVNRVLNKPTDGGQIKPGLHTSVLPDDVVMRPEDLPNDQPTAVRMRAFAGTTTNAAIGLYAGSKMTVRFAGVGELKGNAGAIPLSAVRVSRNVYLPVRGFEQTACMIETHHYRPLTAADGELTVGPGLARTLLVQVDVPADAKPGVYGGNLQFADNSLPFSLQVLPGALPTTSFPVGLFFSGVPAHVDQIGSELYWSATEDMLRQMQRASLTLPTGGPSAGAVWDGKTPHYQGDDFLHYLKLADKYGLNKAVVNYGGLNIGIPRGSLTAHPGMSEAETYAALRKAWDEFSAANHLPPYYVYCYDEPGTDAEFGGVDHVLSVLKTAGFKTIGFTSIEDAANIDEHHMGLIKNGVAVCMAGHTKEALAKVKALGCEPWLYGSIDRSGLGLSLFRAHRYGAQGRLAWIGSIVQGFQYDTMDSREPDPSCFYIHRNLGVLVAPRFVGVMEAGVDLRMLLELERRAGKGAESGKIDAFLSKIDAMPYPSRGMTTAELDDLRGQMAELLGPQ